MASLGAPVLVDGPAGLWLLAHRNHHGLQPTFYNWQTLMDGIAFCARHDERPAIEVRGRRLTLRQVEAVGAIQAGAGTVGRIADHMGASVGVVRRTLVRLQALGLAQIGAEGDATKAQAEAWLTMEGAEVAAALGAA